ncbi:hypothetical protein JTB14_025139 [Gonioctena quinquepunctata]|nr:hypothetical protein JTB14_025139 [Gonioctena quinquepunctata]
MPRESIEDPTSHFRKNKNFDTRGAEYIFPADADQIKKEIKVENTDEDPIGCTDDVFTINADLKTQTLKTEDGIDIVYEDIKPEIHGDKLSGKNDIANIVPNESSIDFGAGTKQNRTVEEDETDVERSTHEFRDTATQIKLDIVGAEFTQSTYGVVQNKAIKLFESTSGVSKHQSTASRRWRLKIFRRRPLSIRLGS